MTKKSLQVDIEVWQKIREECIKERCNANDVLKKRMFEKSFDYIEEKILYPTTINLLAGCDQIQWMNATNIDCILKELNRQQEEIKDIYRNEFGFIYIVLYDNNLTKIGYTQSPYKRIGTLKRQAKQLEKNINQIILSKPHTNYKENEKNILEQIATFNKQHNGEYIKITFEEIKPIIKTLYFNNDISDIEHRLLTNKDHSAVKELMQDIHKLF